MEIFKIRNERSDISLAPAPSREKNKITLLTGPNGCGKTDLLTVLANAFRAKKLLPDGHYVQWRRAGNFFDTLVRHDGAREYPERIIAQTFSPFSRFPSVIKMKTTLTDVYSEGRINENSYITIGFHRSSKFGGANITRQVLKEAIYRISESTHTVNVISQVLLNLGYRDEITFHFESLPQLDAVRRDSDPMGAAMELLKNAAERTNTFKYKSEIIKELRLHGYDGVAELISEAIKILSEFEIKKSIFRYKVRFTEGRRSSDFSVIQSFALLERLKLLRLESCLLTRNSGETIDAANASSGQQQMLCSIIGLATAIKDDSLVLIDEPELSLHPQWQQQFLEFLRAALLPFKDCHVFVATHSPLIVQRARTLGIDVIALGRRQLAEPKRGIDSSVEETLMDVFETPVPYSAHLANKVFGIISLVEEEALSHPDLTPLKAEAEYELEALQRLYHAAPVRDIKSLALLNDALELVRINPYDNNINSNISRDE